MKIRCAHCGETANLPTGHVRRSRRQGMRLFCGRRCSGLGRRKPPVPKSVKRLLKKLYDEGYRAKNRAMLKAKKRAYFARTYDPEKARVERKRTMKRHVEYCRQPEYRRWKSDYDRRLRDAALGEFGEAQRLCIDLNRTIKERMNDYEIRQANGTLNKTQERRRGSGSSERDRHRNRSSNRSRAA